MKLLLKVMQIEFRRFTCVGGFVCVSDKYCLKFLCYKTKTLNFLIFLMLIHLLLLHGTISDPSVTVTIFSVLRLICKFIRKCSQPLSSFCTQYVSHEKAFNNPHTEIFSSSTSLSTERHSLFCLPSILYAMHSLCGGGSYDCIRLSLVLFVFGLTNWIKRKSMGWDFTIFSCGALSLSPSLAWCSSLNALQIPEMAEIHLTKWYNMVQPQHRFWFFWCEAKPHFRPLFPFQSLFLFCLFVCFLLYASL